MTARCENNSIFIDRISSRGSKNMSLLLFIRGEKTAPYLFFLLGHVSPGLHLGFMHGMHLSKVTSIKVLNQQPLFLGHFLKKYDELNRGVILSVDVFKFILAYKTWDIL